LRKEPKPHGIEKLTDFELEDVFFRSLYRIRVGNYRVIYAIEDQIVTITIVRIKHRREVYK
jgi:mRNA interferase RelE/StbE